MDSKLWFKTEAQIEDEISFLSFRVLNCNQYLCCSYIHRLAFQNLTKLNWLRLNDNLLRTIEDGTFLHQSHLQTLDLRNNHWTNLTLSTTGHQPHLLELCICLSMDRLAMAGPLGLNILTMTDCQLHQLLELIDVGKLFSYMSLSTNKVSCYVVYQSQSLSTNMSEITRKMFCCLHHPTFINWDRFQIFFCCHYSLDYNLAQDLQFISFDGSRTRTQG